MISHLPHRPPSHKKTKKEGGICADERRGGRERKEAMTGLARHSALDDPVRDGCCGQWESARVRLAERPLVGCSGGFSQRSLTRRV
jgi:hypothetical protein